MNRRNFLLASSAALVGGGLLYKHFENDIYFARLRWRIGPSLEQRWLNFKERWTQVAWPEITPDCSDRPYDIRPFVNAIMEQTNWILDRLPDNVPLVVIFGEAHTVPSHVLSQVALVRAFKEAGLNFSLGYEFHSSTIEAHFAEFASGARALKASPLSTQLLFQQVLKDSVPFSGNDIKADFLYAKDDPSYQYDSDAIGEGIDPIWMTVVDQSDPFTLKMIRKHKPTLEGQRLLRSANYIGKGQDIDKNVMALSNAAMVDAAQEHLAQTGHRLYLQHCGLNHLLGTRNYALQLSEQPYEDSLCAKFIEKGFAVLNVAPTFMPFPDTALEVMDRTITPKGMNQTTQIVEATVMEVIAEESEMDFSL